ncbi:MAG TPA: hypothetical protein EYH34_10870 [Planctomycetes bacterium]|nr:hypothetical protein [Planctomycetota bacterium]
MLSQKSEREPGRTAALCRLIEGNARRLRGAKRGSRFWLDGVYFRVLQSDRNTVFRIIEGERRWYLKMPRDGSHEAIERELFGMHAVRWVLEGLDTHTLPLEFTGSSEQAYVLTSELPGMPLSSALYRCSLLPLPRLRRHVENAFFSLGAVLARVHRSAIAPGSRTTRSLVTSVTSTVARARMADWRCAKLIEIAEALSPQLATDCLVHGNVGLLNVLTQASKIALIDFECCGRGAAYDDVSLVCGHLIYATAGVHVRNRLLWRVLESFLEGYRAESELDPAILAQGIALRLGQHYVYWFCSGRRRPTIAGLPALRSRVTTLVDEFLVGDPTAALRRLSVGFFRL